MPELPEVQTVVDDLNKKIKGDIIVDFWSDWKKAIKQPSYDQFIRDIKNKKILKAWRLGKNLFIDLSGGKTLYIHLKMTGHLLVKDQENIKTKKQKNTHFSDKVNQYIHHIFYLMQKSKIKAQNDNAKLKIEKKFNKTLEFSDLRKFAKIILIDTEKIKELPEIKKLGVDAMSPGFTLKKFQELLTKRKNKKIGLVLMEQELIAGIGNIYRSEILFESGIDPQRIVSSLRKNEVEKIHSQIKKVLEKAILMRGTSDSDYRDTSGAPGKFQQVLSVYNKEGAYCKKCGTIVERFKMGQRSVFYCPKCQH